MTEQTARLLRDAENYLSALHGSVARHDNLAANYGCAGCELRDQIREAMAAPVSSAGPAPATDRAAAVASCPGYETSPNPCRCPCYGCKHHCAAHNPDDTDLTEPPATDRATLRERIVQVLRTTPSALGAENPQLGFPSHHQPGESGYLGWCALCVRDIDAIADAVVVAVLPAPTDQAAVEPCSCLDNPSLAAEIGYPVRCPHCPTGASAVPPTHWPKHVQRHHPVAADVLPAPDNRAAVLLEAADELGRMDYDTDSNDYGYDTYRDAWNGGVMDAAALLRRRAGEAQQDEAWTRSRDRIAQALIRMDAMVWLGTRRGDRDHDESIGLDALAGRLTDAVLGTSQQPTCPDCGHLACDGQWQCKVLVAGKPCRCLGPAIRSARGAQQDDYEATTGHAITCAAGFGMGCQCDGGESHRLGEQKIREAARWLRADVAFRVLDALDGAQQRPVREAQQDPTQDGTVLAAENEALWGELHRRDTETDQPHPVARPGQPETDEEPTS